MKKPVLLALATCLLTSHAALAADDTSAPASASAKQSAGPDIRADAPERYTVKKGDTLWDIANRYLKDAWRWPEIWETNQQIRNPHLIYPGDQLLLCRIEERSVVALDDGGGCAQVAARLTNRASANGGNLVGKLSPQIRSEPLSVAIPAIPLQAISAYLTENRVVTDDELAKAPYIVAGTGTRIIAGVGDDMYARGSDLQIGNSYGVFRKGAAYIDPDTNESLGYEAEDIGGGSIAAIQKDIGTLHLTRTTQEVRIGDRLLLKQTQPITPVFFPSNPDNVKPGTRIVRVMGSIGSAGLNSVIVLNRGERDGVKQGHTFALYQRGALIRDRIKDDMVRLPSERAGMAMVFRTFEKVSYALVVKASTTIKVGDEARPPVSGD